MTSQDTRSGGRWLAKERGSAEPPEPIALPHEPATAPLVEFLSEKVLMQFIADWAALRS